MVDFGAANSPTTNVGGEHPNINTANGGNDDPLVSGLRALGHVVSISAQSSGIGTILRVQRNGQAQLEGGDRKSTRLNSSHLVISYAVFCLKKKKKKKKEANSINKKLSRDINGALTGAKSKR